MVDSPTRRGPIKTNWSDPRTGKIRPSALLKKIFAQMGDGQVSMQPEQGFAASVPILVARF